MSGEISGYRVIDFTLEELKMLNIRKRPKHDQTLSHRMVSFAEIVEMVHTMNDVATRSINSHHKVGLYVEIKNFGVYRD